MGVQTNGDLRQCCQMIKSPFGKFYKDGNAQKWSEQNVDAVRNSESAKSLRKEMMEGKRPSLCSLCWEEEDVGITTKRLNMLDKYNMEKLLDHTNIDGSIDTTQIPLGYLDLRLGNLCNLKCRSCGPGDSSLWVNDHATLNAVNGKAVLNYNGGQKYDIVKKNDIWKINSNDFEWSTSQEFDTWIERCSENGLERIYFTGGEPTINKKHMDILDIIIKKDKAKITTLEYNTNLVAIPQRLLDQWAQFHHVAIGISVDAKDELAHYMRYPSVWSDIENNCDKIGYGQIPSLTAGISSTISVLNIRHFITLSDWLLNKNYPKLHKYPGWHMLHGPEYMNVQILPKEIKQEIENEYIEWFDTANIKYGEETGRHIKEKYSGIIRFMWQEDKSLLLPKLKTVTEKMDRLRQESMSNTIPWLWNIIKDL